MPSGNYDIHAEQGATFRLYMLYKDSNGDPIDLSSCNAEMQVRRSKNSSDLLLHMYNEGVTGGGSTGSWVAGSSFEGIAGVGGITLNNSSTASVTGGIYITIDPTTTSNLPVGQFFYDLELIQGSVTDRILQGRFNVDGEVTR